MQFTHLHTHSHYSLLDGLAKIDELVAKAKECHMDSLALTDHGVMYGVIEFYKACKEVGIKPIIGVEFYVALESRHDKRPRIDEKRYHLTLLAKNEIGYKNLLKLVTKAHLEGFYYKPRIDLELIKEHHEGLIALTACLKGEVPHLIISGKTAKARELAKMYQEIYGQGNFYLEVQYHPNLPNQKIANEDIYEISKETGIPIVATNDIHYLNPEDDKAQDILLCLQTKKKLEDKDRMNMTGEDFSFRTSEQMIEDFRDQPEAIENTQKIAAACNLKIELGKIRLPAFEVPSGMTAETYLKDLSYKRIKSRYGFEGEEIEKLQSVTGNLSLVTRGDEDDGNGGPSDQLPVTSDNSANTALITKKVIGDRLSYELNIIKKTGFAPYFLIVQDFVNWAKKNGIIVGPGRGSAAGSIVSYLLNITDIDPISYDLLFERFLNPERVSMPDIDLDFADTRRDEVIEYVSQKYGKDRVSQIITFGTMAARAAVRDVGRVLNMSYSYCDGIAKMIPGFRSLDEALEQNSELKEVYENDPQTKKLIDTAKKLEGVARHASTHACGIVITKEASDNYVPLQYDSKTDEKTVVSQYSMNPILDLGLLKMDLLGLKNLTIMENTLKLIKYNYGKEIELDKIPLGDPRTFWLLQNGDTTGVFQLESDGMKRYLVQLKPTELEDIIAMVALYRPGPMEWIPDYINGKHGRKTPHYLHPKLAPILEKTYGVAIYQEQILKIARDLAGFTLGEADILRKAVGKKIKELLTEQKEKFIEGCKKNGVSEEIAKRIFTFIEPFAGYGFNRSHAACYALIAYQTAYFKANYPAEFMASLLTSDQDNTDRIAIEVEECRGMGLAVLPPDINESFKSFTVIQNDSAKNNANRTNLPTQEAGKAIRFGLLAIKNVGENIIETIIQERQENGLFLSLEDFLRRVQTKDLNKKSLESLIKAGALDNFGDRNQILYNIDTLLIYNKNLQREKNNGQTNLFGLFPREQALPSLNLRATKSADKRKKLSWEKELLGLYLSEHPFKEFECQLKEIVLPCSKIHTGPNPQLNQNVKTAGVVTNIQKILTRSGEPMLFVKIEDTSAALEILVFPKLLKETEEIWREEKIVIISGKPSDKDGVTKILVDNVWDITSENLQKVITEVKNVSGSRNFVNGYANHRHNDYQSSRQNVAGATHPGQQQSPSQDNQKVNIVMPQILNQIISEKLNAILKTAPRGQHKVCLLFPHSSRSKTQKIATNLFINFNDELKTKIEQIVGKGKIMLDKF